MINCSYTAPRCSLDVALRTLIAMSLSSHVFVTSREASNSSISGFLITCRLCREPHSCPGSPKVELQQTYSIVPVSSQLLDSRDIILHTGWKAIRYNFECEPQKALTLIHFFGVNLETF